jgi:CP family cyanate transporter-like MFS transporter
VIGVLDERRRGKAKSFVLLWLTGLSLRITLLSVPPLLLRIRANLGLSNVEVAALTTLPLLLFSAAATLGSGIVSFVGARRTLIAGLILAAAASALRGATGSATALFIFTFLMGLGIAAVQPAVPALVQSWVSGAIGRATATYVNGLLVAEAAAASLTPVLLPALGSWEAALAVWAAPVVITAVLVATLTEEAPHSARDPARWIPSWSEGVTWQLGAVQAAGSVAYFASNAMLPVFLAAHGRRDLVDLSLAVLNTSQLLASIVVGALPLAISAGRRVLMLNGAVIAAAAAAAVVEPDLVVLWSAAIGFCSAIVFTVSLALPAALASGKDVARLAAGMMTIGYGCAFLLPLVGGALLDSTGAPWTALSPVVAAGLSATVAGGIAAHTRQLKSEAEGSPPRSR